MFHLPEYIEVTIDVAGLKWHIKNRPYFEYAHFLAEHEGDQILSNIATRVCGITGGEKYHALSPEQARVVISKLTTPQLLELDSKVKNIKKQFKASPFKFNIPKPFDKPHWKKPLDAQDRLSSENRHLIDSVIKSAQEELSHPETTEKLVLKNYDTIQRGLKKAQKDEADSKSRSINDLYPRPEVEDSQTSSKFSKTKERSFVLSEVVQAIWPILTLNMYTLSGRWAENSIVLRYVNKKELMALNQMVQDTVEREKQFCALSIASINNRWCFSYGIIDKEVSDFVNSWTEEDMSNYYGILQKIRDYVETLAPYIEALPFTKIFREFWDINRDKNCWWDDSLTGIPGTGKIPPSELIDLFCQECLGEEKALSKIEDDDKLAFQVAGLSQELAQSIQNKNNELIDARSLQINYMLFNEVPKIKETREGVLAIPGENSREEIISVAQDLLKGKLDYHDTMLALLTQRREAMQRASQAPSPAPTAPESVQDAYEGGSHYATPQEVAAMKRQVASDRAAVDASTLAFSMDVAENISKARKRSLLIQGIDPYHESDESADLGVANVISREKKYH